MRPRARVLFGELHARLASRAVVWCVRCDHGVWCVINRLISVGVVRRNQLVGAWRQMMHAPTSGAVHSLRTYKVGRVEVSDK